jgi:hypothetical protein
MGELNDTGVITFSKSLSKCNQSNLSLDLFKKYKININFYFIKMEY